MTFVLLRERTSRGVDGGADLRVGNVGTEFGEVREWIKGGGERDPVGVWRFLMTIRCLISGGNRL